MIVGRDGTSMVSVYMTSVAIELRMARVFQADLGILSAFLIMDDDVFSLEPFESDILLFLLSSSNSYHAYV
jgi:fibrillarin-like rRNA methylase